MPVTRGFFRKRPDGPEGRLPPGQYDTGAGWPVLTAEATPRLDTATWTMSVDGLVETPTTWTWDEIHALPGSTFTGDIHCVTTWSKFDTVFAGVSVDVLLEQARPRSDARFVMARSTTGYTTNLPLEDLTGGKAWVVWDFNGMPLQREHGGPVRLLVPHLYFWKSAKWVTRLELMAEDRPGSGSRTATTTAATRGSSSATRATEWARSTTSRRDPRRGRPAPSSRRTCRRRRPSA